MKALLWWWWQSVKSPRYLAGDGSTALDMLYPDLQGQRELMDSRQDREGGSSSPLPSKNKTSTAHSLKGLGALNMPRPQRTADG
eukprot:1151186-Pelagomonas_calceolata.AAC.16